MWWHGEQKEEKLYVQKFNTNLLHDTQSVVQQVGIELLKNKI
jgi:hypothetical protein